MLTQNFVRTSCNQTGGKKDELGEIAYEEYTIKGNRKGGEKEKSTTLSEFRENDDANRY